MRTLHILLLLLISGTIYADGQQTFNAVALKEQNNRNTLHFSVPEEVNAYQYRILAGDDSSKLELIGTLKPAGNSVLTRNYKYELYQPLYKYYRVALVQMNATFVNSPIINAFEKHNMGPEPYIDIPQNNNSPAIASGR